MILQASPWKLFAVSVFLGAALNCARSEPNEGAFARAVAMEVVNDELIKAKKIVVLNSDQFSELPQALPVAVEQRLNALSVPWVQTKIGAAWEDFPGIWDKSDYYSYNKTHILVTLRVQGSKFRRTVEWMHVCGPGCGSGVKVVFVWSGGRWSQTREARIKY